MPINTPELQGSIKPYIAEVKHYLLTTMANRPKYPANWGRLAHLKRVHAFAETINPNTTTIKNLLDTLLQEGVLDIMDTNRYIDKILNGLRIYLTQTDPYSNNALMLAARYRPDELASILEAMAHLGPDLQTTILKQVSTPWGNNALMIAAYYQPEAVTLILTAMAHLNLSQQDEILRQVDAIDGYNSLMYATRYQPDAVALILETMEPLSPDLQTEILRQVDTGWGDNALMIALKEKNHKCVDLILSRVSTLSPKQKEQILLTPNKEGKKTLNLTTGHFYGELSPSHANIEALIDSISSPLPLEVDTPVISTSNDPLPTISSALASSSTACPTGFFHHPDTSTAKLLHIEKLPAVEELHLSDECLAIEEASHQKNTVILSSSNNPKKIFNKKLLDYAKGRLNGYLYGVSNVLFRQIRNHPKDVEQIIEQIEKEEITNVGEVIVKLEHLAAVKPEKTLAKRIEQIRHKCLFESAVRYQPYTIGPLLDVLRSLHIETVKIPVLSDITIHRANRFLCEARYIPDAIGPYLKKINNLQGEALKAAFLSQINEDSWSTLIFATRYHPSEVEPLLKALNSLQDEKTVLLKQCYPNNKKIPAEHNALMLAAAYEPAAIESILLAITTLDIEDQIDIFSKTNEQGNNALQLAVNYKHSHSEALIRQAMEKFIPSTITKPAALSSSSSTLQILDREELDHLDAEHSDPVIDSAAGSASCR